MPQDLSKLPLKYTLHKDGELVGSIGVKPTENNRVTVVLTFGSKAKRCRPFDPTVIPVDEVISTLIAQRMWFATGQDFCLIAGKTWREKLNQMGYAVVEVS